LLSSAVIFALTNTFGLFQSALYGIQRLDWVAGINVATTIQLAIGTVVALQMGSGLYGLVINVIGVELVSALLFVFAVRRLLPGGRIRLDAFHLQRARELLTYGARIQVTNLGSLASTQFNKVLAGHFLSLTTVAAFELGLRVAYNITLLPVWSLAAVLPVASEMQTLSDRPRLIELYHRGTRYIWISATLLAGLVWLTAPQIMAIWTATLQPQAALVTRWLAFAYWINLTTAVSTTIARGIGRAGLETRYALVVVVLQLTWTVLLAGWFGLNGLLFANTVAIGIGSLYFVVLFHRDLAESLFSFAREILVGPLLVTLPIAVLGLLLLGQLPLSIFTDRSVGIPLLGLSASLYAALYFAGLWTLRYIRPSDLRAFRGAIRTGGRARS
jgi:O-antigen/teichoic acid export membrane protein